MSFQGQKKRTLTINSFLKNVCSLLSLGSSRFFSMASRKAYARLRDSEDARIHSNSDSFNGLVGPCQLRVPNPPSVGGPNVQRVRGSTFDARDGVTLRQKPVRHWWSFSVALRTNTSKLISMKPQKFQAFSSQSSWKKYAEMVFPFYLSMDYHGLSLMG